MACRLINGQMKITAQVKKPEVLDEKTWCWSSGNKLTGNQNVLARDTKNFVQIWTIFCLLFIHKNKKKRFPISNRKSFNAESFRLPFMPLPEKFFRENLREITVA